MKEAINLCTALREVCKKVFVLLRVAFFQCVASGKLWQWQSARSAGVTAPGGQLRTGCCSLCSWVAADTGNTG